MKRRRRRGWSGATKKVTGRESGGLSEVPRPAACASRRVAAALARAQHRRGPSFPRASLSLSRSPGPTGGRSGSRQSESARRLRASGRRSVLPGSSWHLRPRGGPALRSASNPCVHRVPAGSCVAFYSAPWAPSLTETARFLLAVRTRRGESLLAASLSVKDANGVQFLLKKS